MTNPKEHEVVERVEKFAKDLGDEYKKRGFSDWAPPIASAASRAGVYFGIGLGLEMEAVKVMREELADMLSDHTDICQCFKCKTLRAFDALKLLHVPSGEG